MHMTQHHSENGRKSKNQCQESKQATGKRMEIRHLMQKLHSRACACAHTHTHTHTHTNSERRESKQNINDMLSSWFLSPLRCWSSFWLCSFLIVNSATMVLTVWVSLHHTDRSDSTPNQLVLRNFHAGHQGGWPFFTSHFQCVSIHDSCCPAHHLLHLGSCY